MPALHTPHSTSSSLLLDEEDSSLESESEVDAALARFLGAGLVALTVRAVGALPPFVPVVVGRGRCGTAAPLGWWVAVFGWSGNDSQPVRPALVSDPCWFEEEEEVVAVVPQR